MSEETANSANSAENTDANLRIMQGGHSAEHWFKRCLAAQDRYEITLRRLREAEAERDALRDRDREWFESVFRKLLIQQEFAKMRAAEPEVSFVHSHAAKILQQVIDNMNLHAHKTEGEA